MGKRGYITAGLLISLAITACNNGVGNLQPDELHRRAQTLPLAERYALYLDVYKSRTPSNPLLADDLVKLGAPARAYIINRAMAGNVVEFQAALPVLSAFGTGCTKREDATLRIKGKELASDEALKQALLSHIAVVCRSKPPAGWR